MNVVRRYLGNAVSYLLVGLVCALTEWTTFYFTVSAGVGFVVAAFAGFMIATALNYILSVTLIFRSRGRSRMQEVVLTYLISLVAMGLNLAVTALVISYLPLPHEPVSMTGAKIVGTGFGLIINFLGRQFFIFDKNV